MDKTDKEIISQLIDDATLTAPEIAKKLKRKKISLTPRAVRKRIISLQKNNSISKFTIIPNDEINGKSIKRIILVQFKHAENFLKRLEEYRQYIDESPQCAFAVRVRGNLDWIHYKCFPNKHLADLEDDVFRQLFGDILNEYHSYDAEVMKDNYNGMVTEDALKEHLFKYANNTMIG